MSLPFVLLLAALAAGPLFFESWWKRHFGKVAAGLSLVPLVYYLLVIHSPQEILHTVREYVSFIALIGSLYVVAGGIHIRLKGEATPAFNVLFLATGAVIANFLGTTGASMLLIRPWLRMNKYRLTQFHVVFFIFIVSNAGGSLTPIGDPPLFLGYLQGVPFWWVLQNCWQIWLVAVGALLAIFYVLDRKNFMRAPRDVRQAETQHHDWHFDGLLNVVLLGVIIGAVFIKDPLFLREGLMMGAALASWFFTGKKIHEANDFHFEPIEEVIIIFAGIFLTMLPALQWLETHAATLGLKSPSAYYWGCGILSSLLDNAPTYLSFLSTATGVFAPEAGAQKIPMLLDSPAGSLCLKAISVAAVFFGANTYIGNGPNFMVKAIAEHQKAPVPGFVGYILKFTLPFLFPVLAAIWLLFFRR